MDINMNPKYYEMAVSLRHELHMHPELSNNEVWTKQHLISFLKQHTSLKVVDRGSWFYAVYYSRSSDAKKIAFRADIDALPIDETISLPYGSRIPGVSHKCGHDGHSATLAAFALEVDNQHPSNTIYFIFQHAEETGDGALQCRSLLKEEGIDEIFGYHNQPGFPKGDIIVNSGSFQCASKGMSMFFDGITSHASDPGVGRNPALAIARLICALPMLSKAEDYKGILMATVVNVDIGTPAFGTAAGAGVLRVTLRAQYEDEMDILQNRIDVLAFKLASEHGLKYRTQYSDYFAECYNHPCCVDKIINVCKKHKIPLHEYNYPKRGSEDFGFYTKITKGAIFNVGAGDITDHHTVEYDFPDDIIPSAVTIFKGLAGMNE